MSKNYKIVESLPQIWIAVFGCLAIWFISRPEDWSCYGYIFGLISQPAWLYTSIKNKQYGILLLSIWYTYSWIQGIYYHFHF